MIICSLQIGHVVERPYRDKAVPTAIFKSPVAGPLRLTELGFVGDQQGDMVHHGGPDKAALVYAQAHYPHWERFLGRSPGPAVMGENVTVDGLTEETVHIGDIYRIGGALVEVAQPRIPCYKTNLRHGRSDILDEVLATLYTGFYVRVLEEGEVQAGDQVTLVERPPSAPTVAYANQILHRAQVNGDGYQRLLEAKGLAEVWRTIIRNRLAKL